MSPNARISLDGDELVLTFEAHSVRVPFSLKGLAVIREQLRARRDPYQRTVSTPGALTQELVDRWLLDYKPKRARVTFEIDLEDIEI